MSHWTDRSVDTALNIFDYAQNLVSPSLKLGVTGLSRSGKTVFITALIYHLLKRDQLRFFEAQNAARIKKVYLEPHPNDLLPRFDYEGNLAKLTDSLPTWPESTKNISQLRITIEFQSDEFPQKYFGTNTQHIDIVDYPGEWLLDLQLLEKDYQRWSREAFEFALRPENRQRSEPWRNLTKLTPSNGPLNEAKAKELSDAFRAFLTTARNENPHLPGIPPGRFLLPGDLEGAPALTFAPLKLENDKLNEPDTMTALMQRRYKAYQEEIVRPFYRKFFTRLDRQIILIDVLSVLNQGVDHLNHLQTSLEQILKNFNPGANHWLTSIWNKKTDRLVFAATKADHLHHKDHDALQDLLAGLTQKAIQTANIAGADIKIQALAALRTTREVEVEQNGTIFEALKGTPAKGEIFQAKTFNGTEEALLFPGDLSIHLANKETQNEKAITQSPHIDILNFLPPKANQASLMPHIRLDRAINMLIGDKLK